MEKTRLELFRGTLDILILKSLIWGPLHGYAITSLIRRQSDEQGLASFCGVAIQFSEWLAICLRIVEYGCTLPSDRTRDSLNFAFSLFLKLADNWRENA